jgi:hypothetical protein
LEYNLLNTLPKTIGNLPHLSQLNLERNSLINLPVEIGMCTSIKFLNVSRNQFREFPIGICKLESLQVLDVSYCGVIGPLPDCIRYFSMLDRLYIDNRVSIPMSLNTRTRLQIFMK